MGDNKTAPVVITLAESRLRDDKNEAVRLELLGHLDSGEVNLVVDFSAVEFVDSSFLGLLVIALKRASAAGGDIRLCCLQKPVRTIFQLMRLHRIFDIHENVESAVAAFS